MKPKVLTTTINATTKAYLYEGTDHNTKENLIWKDIDQDVIDEIIEEEDHKGIWVDVKRNSKSKYKKFWVEIVERQLWYYKKDPYLGGKVFGVFLFEDDTKITLRDDVKKNLFFVLLKTKGGKLSFRFRKEEGRDLFEEKCLEVRDLEGDELVSDFSEELIQMQCLDPTLCFDDTSEPSTLPVDDFWDLELIDFEKEEALTIDTIVGGKTTVFFLLRNYGCAFCRHLIWKLLQRINEFERLGYQLIAVGSGNAEAATQFKEELQFPGILLNDPHRYLYKAFNFRKHLKFSKKSWTAFSSAFSNGFKPVLYDKSHGSSAQLGGCVVINKDYGLIYQHKENFVGNSVDLDDLIQTIRTFSFTFPEASWGSSFNPIPWDDLCVTSVIPPLFKDENGYKLEVGKNLDIAKTLSLLGDRKYFQDLYLPKNNYNLWALEGSTKDPFVIAITEGMYDTYGLIFCKTGILRVLIPERYTRKRSELFNYVMTYMKMDSKKQKYSFLNMNLTASEDLIKIENSLIPRKHRIGVLYAPNGVSTEEEMYAVNETSKDFIEFLDFLAQEIQLENWDKYAGGLDITSHHYNGPTTYYTCYEENEMMFHIAPLIPQVRDDPARKRYVGNDIVVIIFSEGNCVDLSSFYSQFNQTFFVVEKTGTEENLCYRVEVAVKENVQSFPPYLPKIPVFAANEGFRDFLITKLLHAEYVSLLSSPQLTKNLQRTNMQLISETIKTHCKKSKSSRTSSRQIKKEKSQRNSVKDLSFSMKVKRTKSTDKQTSRERSGSRSLSKTDHNSVRSETTKTTTFSTSKSQKYFN